MTESTSKQLVRKGRIFPEIQWSSEQIASHKAQQESFYQRCWIIFEQVKADLINKYYGWYIAIEPNSGDYFIDPDVEIASQKAFLKHPHAIHHIFGINEGGISGKI